MTIEENKKVAIKYYDHNPDEVELLLTPGFIGHTNDKTWNRDDHKNTWISIQHQMKDTINQQVAEGDWVATWFTRTGILENNPVNWNLMSFTRFVGGKISEVWETALDAKSGLAPTW